MVDGDRGATRSEEKLRRRGRPRRRCYHHRADLVPCREEAEQAEQRDYLEPADLAATVDIEQAVQGKRLINAGNANVLIVQGSTDSSFIYMCSRCVPVIHSVNKKS